MWLLFLGKFETLGSNFSYETAGLLASLTTTLGSLFLRLFLRQIINSHHIKRTFHCSKSNGSQSGYHYLGKFETLGSNFRHETPLVLLPKFSTTFTDFILLRTLLIQKSRNRLPRSSKGSSSHTGLLLLGKFETLGSNFSYETAGLLAPLTTTLGSLFLRLQFHKNNLQIITQRCIWCHWKIHRQFLLMC